MDADSLPTTAVELRSRALAAVRADDLETARGLLEAAVQAEPGDIAAWTNYGAVLGELGLGQEARRALESARRLDPQALEPIANLGVLARESGELGLAEELFRAILERAPNDIAARYNLGHTLFLAARFDDAAAAYREGLRLDPGKTPNQNARLAWALVAGGRGGEAERELRRALDRIPAEETAALLAEASEVLPAIASISAVTASAVDALSTIIRRWSQARGVPSHTMGDEVTPEE